MVRKLKVAQSSVNSQSDLIKKAQAMQEKMLQIQEELKDLYVEETVAGGLVKVKADGQKNIVDIKISLDIINDAAEDETADELSALVLSAVNGAIKKAEELAEREMSVVTGGVSIPGLF
ncbi:YbaB/EbfC family nucleoid-associated protein [Streptobacillus notomytis]|uniref:YbaB/EbfC family nucleoid-associated protein n=1 Tax=Streptobacillus notomytis TaxID=1712031 RepID=UPI000936AD10|nr:YbaB/EbfC family nucleoid-associated protein [Streptobacillus notomytis]